MTSYLIIGLFISGVSNYFCFANIPLFLEMKNCDLGFSFFLFFFSNSSSFLYFNLLLSVSRIPGDSQSPGCKNYTFLGSLQIELSLSILGPADYYTPPGPKDACLLLLARFENIGVSIKLSASEFLFIVDIKF